MIFDLLAPPKGPRGWGLKISAVARPIHVSNTHTKFGWISSNGLGGDSVTDRRTDDRMDRRTDRQTDGRTEAIAISPTLFKKSVGINITSVLNCWLGKQEVASRSPLEHLSI